MSTDERDPGVADALAAIAVPDHGPQFWSRLEAALAAAHGDQERAAPTAATSVFLAADEPEAAVAVAAPAEIELEPPTPLEPAEGAGRRWGRRAARALLAVAAVVAVVVAGIAVAQRDDTGPDLSSRPGPTDPTTPVTSTSPDLPPEGRAVLDFVDALGRGDTAAAAALIGPRSEAYLIAQSGSVEAFLAEASEGFGAWSASPDRRVSITRDMGGAAVVVLSGTVQQEGTTGTRDDAFPVVRSESADAYFVDLWAFDPDVEDQRAVFLHPVPEAEGVVVKPGEEIQVSFGYPGTAWFALDGGTPDQVAPVDAPSDPPGAEQLTWTVPADAKPGSFVVMAYQSDSGTTYYADAIPVISG